MCEVLKYEEENRTVTEHNRSWLTDPCIDQPCAGGRQSSASARASPPPCRRGTPDTVPLDSGARQGGVISNDKGDRETTVKLKCALQKMYSDEFVICFHSFVCFGW